MILLVMLVVAATLGSVAIAIQKAPLNGGTVRFTGSSCGTTSCNEGRVMASCGGSCSSPRADCGAACS